MIKQFKQLWNTLPTPDAVDQVYFGNFFPFIARIWGHGLSKEEAKPFYELLEYSHLYSRRNLSLKALEFKKQANALGLLRMDSNASFAVVAVETYLEYGFDYVLVGMKKKKYVEEMAHLF